MIKFFISSTFQDMLAERNLLHKEIVPALREVARAKGEYIDICDLRWGIDHGNTGGSEKINLIAEVCLEEIDQCKPYFIAFLGDYYGTVIDEVIQTEQLKESTFARTTNGMSLTQLELEYAILQNRTIKANTIKPICLFRRLTNGDEIFKKEQSEYRFEKQKKLKKKLKDLGQDKRIVSIDYSATWDEQEGEAIDLGQMTKALYSEMEKIIEQEAKQSQPLNWIEKEFLQADSFCAQYTMNFAGREQLICDILEKIYDDSLNTICISGDSASGKSALLAHLYKSDKLEDIESCFIACGYGARSQTYLDVLKQLTYFVEKHLYPACKISTAYTEEAAEEQLRDVIQKYENANKEETLLLFVDAIDKIDIYNNVKLHLLMEGLQQKKITLICSQIDQFYNDSNSIAKFRIGNLSEQDIQSIMLENIRHKKGNAVHLERLVSGLVKKQDNGSPLYIIAAMNILLINTTMTRGTENVFDLYQNLIEEMPEQIEDIILKNIEEAGNYLDFPYYEITYLLAASQDGLRESDLEGIWTAFISQEKSNWQVLEFVRFRRFLNRFFRCHSNGCWTLNHDKIRESIQNKLQEKLMYYVEMILNYMRTLDKFDSIRISEGLWASKKLMDYGLAKEILEDIAQCDNMGIYTLVMSVLDKITKTPEGKKWYISFANNYPDTIENILIQGLMHHGSVDYERRYPAKELADIYFESRDYTNIQEYLNERMKEQKTLENKIRFCVLCTEYVGIYDDISRQWETFPFEMPLYELISGPLLFDKLSESQKESVFKQINGVFYANNRIINDIVKKKILVNATEREKVISISEKFIAWYNENIRGELSCFKGQNFIEGKFVNNIAQYYSARKEYKSVYGYRLVALKIKTLDFVNMIGRDELFYEMERILSEHEKIKVHIAYWENVEDFYYRYLKDRALEDNEKEKQRRVNASVKWTRVAVSYRCIGSDYFNRYIDEGQDDFLWGAYENMDLCLKMMNFPQLEGNQKEKIMSEILMIGIVAKMFTQHLVDNQQDQFLAFIEKTVNEAVMFPNMDMHELDKLKKNIRNCNNALSNEYRARLSKLAELLTE